MKLTVLSSTNRPQSMTRKVAGYVEKLLKKNLTDKDELQLLDLQELPPDIFNPKVYAEKPESFKPFADAIINTNGIIMVMPEYNGGAPGILKYFIDMLPFPSSLVHKPVAFVGLSAGRFGAIRSVEQIQQICIYRNAYVYPERVFINFIDKSINNEGKPLDDEVNKLMEEEMIGFVNFAKKFC